MIENTNSRPQWKRRLTIERGIRKQDKSETIGEDIGVLSYKTGMSLGTERRVQVLCSNEPLIEIHQDDKGYVTVEVQGVSSQAVRVILSPLSDQETKENTLTESRREFVIE